MSEIYRAPSLEFDHADELQLCVLPYVARNVRVEGYVIRDDELCAEPLEVETREGSLWLRVAEIREAVEGMSNPAIYVLPDGRELAYIRVLFDVESTAVESEP